MATDLESSARMFLHQCSLECVFFENGVCAWARVVSSLAYEALSEDGYRKMCLWCFVLDETEFVLKF